MSKFEGIYSESPNWNWLQHFVKEEQRVLPTVNKKVHREKYKKYPIISFLLFLWSSYFTDNLSRRSTTIISLSSTFESYSASKTNDGILNTTSIYCSHTDVNQERAWLQVDLGKPYSISSVKIYYRKDGMNILFLLILYYLN